MLKLLKKTKGKALNKTAKSMIGLYLKKKNIGELKDFSIDMDEKKFNVSFIPKHFGEVLSVEAVNYNIIKDEVKQKNYLTFESINTFGNWDDSRFKKMIKSKSIEIPQKYSKLIDMVV
jgi:hypothetical protein